MRQLLPLFLMIALTGCAEQVHKLHDLQPAATDFPGALASEYKDYADSELEQGRRSVANHFANKGLDSLAGKQVAPEAADTSLPEATQQQLAEARAQLEKFLNDDVKQGNPQKLAHAQLLFDCWQTEELRKLNQEIAPCEAEFHSTVGELQDVADAKALPAQSSFVVNFAPKSLVLDKAARAIVADVAKQVQGSAHYTVKLVTYTGKGHEQRRISDTRVKAVRKALVKAKVGEKHIHVKKISGNVVVLGRDAVSRDAKKVTIVVKTHSKPVVVVPKPAADAGAAEAAAAAPAAGAIEPIAPVEIENGGTK